MKNLAIVVGIVLCVVSLGFSQSAPVPLMAVQEGVYFTQNGYSTTIIELHAGQFRYWFDSDVKVRNAPQYPLTGLYAADHGKVTLPHQQIYEREWTCMLYDGQATLWRPAALQHWNEHQQIDHYGVLFPTARTPEEIWQRTQ